MGIPSVSEPGDRGRISPSSATGAAALFVFRRLIGLRFSSCWSQRRRVSRPISIPIRCKPAASVSTDSPSRRNRSSSSRCGSNRSAARWRGCRDWAAAWASVKGRMGGDGWLSGSGMVVAEEWYGWWRSNATGVAEADSKRERLDVGVLTQSIFLYGLNRSHSFCGYSIGWLSQWNDWLGQGLDSLEALDSLSFRLPDFVQEQHSFPIGFIDQGLIEGGGGC